MFIRDCVSNFFRRFTNKEEGQFEKVLTHEEIGKIKQLESLGYGHLAQIGFSGGFKRVPGGHLLGSSLYLSGIRGFEQPPVLDKVPQESPSISFKNDGDSWDKEMQRIIK
jgi:hypothetical protein